VEAAVKGEPQYWDMPYLPIDPADLGQTYEAVIRVNSQSGKGGIAYLVKQHLGLDLPRKMQIAFYQVIQAISDREAREMSVDDITTAFRSMYHFGGPKYQGRLALRDFRISAKPNESQDGGTDEQPDEQRHFDGTLLVDGVLRVVWGDGNGPLSALLDALCRYLQINFTIREYSEHVVGEGKAASFVEVVPADDRKSTTSWWGVSVDSDIAGSGLRALLSAVNSAIGDRTLPELKLNVGFGATSAQDDIASAIINALGLALPRRFQSSFFEVVQRYARDRECQISYDDLIQLFQNTYFFGKPSKFGLVSFKMEHLDATRRQLTGELLFSGEKRAVSGEGNGPLSAILAAFNQQINGTLSIREYSEHSIGEGTEVMAASYVELLYDVPGQKKRSAWGVGADADITASGLKAVLNSASVLDVVAK